MNKKNIPNYITIFRFTLVPIICYLITMKTFIFAIIATWLFLLACISDFLDGYLARKLNSESEFGRCFDNIADKFKSGDPEHAFGYQNLDGSISLTS